MEKIRNYFMNKTKKEIFKDLFFSFAWLIVLLFVLDIVTKWIMVKKLIPYHDTVVIPNFFYLTLSFNEGAAFGLGSNGEPGWRILFIVISVVMSAGMLGYYIKKGKELNVYYRLALSMMIAGALGNLIDRAFYWDKTVGFSGVVDFLSFQFGTFRYATFNVADASLVVGVFILIIKMLTDDIKASKQKKKEDLSKPPQEYLDELEKKKDD